MLSPTDDDNHNVDECQKIIELTLAGAIALVLRENTGSPYTVDRLVAAIKPRYHLLKRLDGTKYTGDLRKAIKSCVTSTGYFDKTDDGTAFTINESVWSNYEENLKTKVRNKLAKKRNRKRKSADNNDDDDEDDEGVKKRGKYITRPQKRSRVIALLSLLHQKNCESGLLQSRTKFRRNPFKDVEKLAVSSSQQNVNLIESTLKNRVKEEEFVSILQAFHYFEPLLLPSIRDSDLAGMPSELVNKVKAAKRKVVGPNSQSDAKAIKGAISLIQNAHVRLQEAHDVLIEVNNSSSSTSSVSSPVVTSMLNGDVNV